jgi:hypothetical protein
MKISKGLFDLITRDAEPSSTLRTGTRSKITRYIIGGHVFTATWTLTDNETTYAILERI